MREGCTEITIHSALALASEREEALPLSSCVDIYTRLSAWREISLAKAGYRGRKGGCKEAEGLSPAGDKRREDK